MASASAVRPRIAFMKKLRSMPFQSMCRALVRGRPGFMNPTAAAPQLGDVRRDPPRLVAGEEVCRRAPSQMSQMMSGAAAPPGAGARLSEGARGKAGAPSTRCSRSIFKMHSSDR
jgi:hypothetical protein